MKYLIFIVVCVLMQSCGSDCTKVYFTENDKTWFENYKPGNTLIFKSQRNDFDTIYITNKVMKTPEGACNPFVSNFDKEFVHVDYKTKKDTFQTVEDYLIQISANETLENSSPVIRVLNLEFSNYKHILPKTKVSELNTDWKHVYTFNKDNCEYANLNGTFGLTEFEWDKAYGLVSYTNAKGEKWVLVKKE